MHIPTLSRREERWKSYSRIRSLWSRAPVRALVLASPKHSRMRARSLAVAFEQLLEQIRVAHLPAFEHDLDAVEFRAIGMETAHRDARR